MIRRCNATWRQAYLATSLPCGEAAHQYVTRNYDGVGWSHVWSLPVFPAQPRRLPLVSMLRIPEMLDRWTAVLVAVSGLLCVPPRRSLPDGADAAHARTTPRRPAGAGTRVLPAALRGCQGRVIGSPSCPLRRACPGPCCEQWRVCFGLLRGACVGLCSGVAPGAVPDCVVWPADVSACGAERRPVQVASCARTRPHVQRLSCVACYGTRVLCMGHVAAVYKRVAGCAWIRA